MSNITQLVKKEKQMATLNKAVIAAGLEELLSGKGPFTVFAPSDQAFAKLEKETMTHLLQPQNKAELASLLSHHVVAGNISYNNLKNGDKLKTLSGKELLVGVQLSKVTIDGVRIHNHDMKTTNGVVHGLDAVLKN